MIYQILNSYQNVIVLNSHIEKSLLPYIAKSHCIIAADGAAIQLDRCKIEPHYIVGDHDSFHLAKWEDRYLPFYDQNRTDFEKAIEFTKKMGKFPSLVVGMNGGEIDHILGNIHVMMRPSNKSNLFFLDAQITSEKRRVTQLGLPLMNEIFRSKVKKGTNLSILPFPSLRCTSKGLYWELDDQLLEIHHGFSLRNRVKSEDVEIQAMGQGLLIMDLD